MAAPDENQQQANVHQTSADVKPLLNQISQRIKENLVSYFQQEFKELRDQISQLDQQLEQRYPQRYSQLKQQAQDRVSQVAAPVRERLQALDPKMVQEQVQQHTWFDAKMGAWGQAVAQQERKIKQYLHQQVLQRWQP